MRPSLLPTILLATALLGGCIVEPPAPDATQPAREPHNTTAAAEPRSTADEKPTQPQENGPGPATEAREPTPSSSDISFEGRTDTRSCLPGQVVSDCPTVLRGHNASKALEGMTRPIHLDGVLRWDPSTTSNEYLVAYLIVDGKELMYGMGGQGRVRGESPLNVSIDLARHQGHTLALGITNDECMLETAPAASCAFAGSGFFDLVQGATGQDFAFDGTLTGWA